MSSSEASEAPTAPAVSAALTTPETPAAPTIQPKKKDWEYSTNPNTVRARKRKANLTDYQREYEQAKANDSKSVHRSCVIRSDSESFSLMSHQERADELAVVTESVMKRRRAQGRDFESRMRRFRLEHPEKVPGNQSVVLSRAVTPTGGAANGTGIVDEANGGVVTFGAGPGSTGAVNGSSPGTPGTLTQSPTHPASQSSFHFTILPDGQPSINHLTSGSLASGILPSMERGDSQSSASSQAYTMAPETTGALLEPQWRFQKAPEYDIRPRNQQLFASQPQRDSQASIAANTRLETELAAMRDQVKQLRNQVDGLKTFGSAGRAAFGDPSVVERHAFVDGHAPANGNDLAVASHHRVSNHRHAIGDPAIGDPVIDDASTADSKLQVIKENFETIANAATNIVDVLEDRVTVSEKIGDSAGNHYDATAITESDSEL